MKDGFNLNMNSLESFCVCVHVRTRWVFEIFLCSEILYGEVNNGLANYIVSWMVDSVYGLVWHIQLCGLRIFFMTVWF